MTLEEIGYKEKFKVCKMSKLFVLEDDKILKLFKNPRELYELERYKYFLDYENDSFIFPLEFIYDSKKFYGYITKRVYGDTLESIFSKSDLLKLSSSSLKLEKNIDFISSGGITLYDFHSENVLYDGKNYSVIDHDENGISNNLEYARNKNQYAHRILIGKLFFEKLEEIDRQHTKLIRKNILENMYSKIRPSEMIIKIKEQIDKEYKEDIKVLENIKNIVRR